MIVKRRVSYGRQAVNDTDIDAVVETLRSDFLTQGPRVEAFEEALADYCGARFAVATSSGTGALHIAAIAGGLKEGTSLLTSTLTFLSSANIGPFTESTPYLSDIDARTFNIDEESLQKTLDRHGDIGLMLPVHFAGLPCNMERLDEICRERGVTVIEDGCHALGASYRDSKGEVHKVGSCSHSHMTVFSFHPVKSITTGEGGAVTTNDEELYRRLKSLRSHGVVRDQGDLKRKDEGPWYYEMQELGFNYRMSDISAALGLSQLKRLDSFIERRRAIGGLYNDLLDPMPFIDPPYTDSASTAGGTTIDTSLSSYHLYPVRISFDELNIDKGELFKRMKEEGINLQVHYIPVHLHPYYMERYGFKEGDFPVAEGFYREEVSLPIFADLTDSEVVGVVTTLASVIETLRAESS